LSFRTGRRRGHPIVHRSIVWEASDTIQVEQSLILDESDRVDGIL